MSEGEGFIPQKEVEESEEEPVKPAPITNRKTKNDEIPTEHRLNHVTFKRVQNSNGIQAIGRVPISQLGLAQKDIYALCAKFAPVAAKVLSLSL